MKSFAVTLTLGIAFTTSASAAVLGTYRFTSSSTDVPSVEQHGSFGPVILPGLNNVSSPGALSLSGFTTGASDLGQFVQFTLAPNPSYTLTLSGFEWTTTRSAEGPASLSLRLFEGTNPANDDPALAFGVTHPPESSQTVSFSPDMPVSSEDGFTLRFYGFSAGSASGTLTLDNLSVFGEISSTPIPPVPEPATGSLALGGIALLAMKAFRRR